MTLLSDIAATSNGSGVFSQSSPLSITPTGGTGIVVGCVEGGGSGFGGSPCAVTLALSWTKMPDSEECSGISNYFSFTAYQYRPASLPTDLSIHWSGPPQDVGYRFVTIPQSAGLGSAPVQTKGVNENPGSAGTLVLDDAPTPGSLGILIYASHASGHPLIGGVPTGWTLLSDANGYLEIYGRIHQIGDPASVPSAYANIANPVATYYSEWGASAPVADFTSTPAQAGSATEFEDTSSSAPTSWAWTFGDGGTSTSQNPTHVYATTGTFSVTLTATNAFGSDSVSHSVIIVAAGTPDPPEPAGVLLEIYAHAPGAARWDVAKWDEATWGEGGWRDVTPYGITVDIDWGSRRPELGILSTPDTASWNVEYYDPDRILDPANEDGPYFGDLIPFLPIRVSHRGTVVRKGYASVISHNYSDPGRGGMRCADNISVLANAMVPSDTTLSDTLYARAVDAIAAAGLSVTVAAPVGTDPPVSPWVTATREWSVWDWIKDAAQEVLYIPIIDRLGTLTFRPWASPMARGRVLGSPELLDLGVVTDWSGLFSIITARVDEDTIETRALTPPPRYGARTYARDEITIDAGDWAAAVLADRGLPTLLWKPGDMRPLTAVSTELLATIEAVELVTLSYPEADPPITASGIVVGGSIHIEGKRDDSAIWRFHYELAQTATEPLIETGGEATDYLLRTGGGEYLYPTGSA